MPAKRHHHSLPTPKQVSFSPRARTVRVQYSAPTTSGKRQSTLTQLDYVSTPNSYKHDIDSLDDDGDHSDPRPSKRRKTRSLKKPRLRERQSTLTQNVRHLQAAMKLKEVMDSDDEEPSLSNNNCLEVRSDDTHLASHSQERNPARTAAVSLARIDRVSTSPSLHESPQRLVPSSQKTDDSTRPTTAESILQPRTPHRVDKNEVPSSETPVSIKLSPSRVKDRDAYARSPLKEKNVNTLDRKQDDGNVFHRDLYEPKLGLEPATSPTEALQTSKTPRPNKSLSSSSKNALDCGHGSQKRSLKRTYTIADSDADPDDLERNEEADTATHNQDLDHDKLYYRRTYQQHTYDPVSAALDLDAARFGFTQTQSRGRRFRDRVLVEDTDASESEGESQGAQMVQDSWAGHNDDQQAEGSKHSDDVSSQLSQNSMLEEGHQRGKQSIADSQVQVSSSPIARPSPPPLRPSQISTVVSTQASGDGHSASRYYVPCSPQPSAPTSLRTQPSSPFALPPWSIPTLLYDDEKTTKSGRTYKDQHGDSLVDFSLPPPPPSSQQQI